MNNENITYQKDYAKTIDHINSIINNQPKKSPIVIKSALKKIISENMAKNNVYYIVYKIVYISLLTKSNINTTNNDDKLIYILKTAIKNNRDIQNNFKELKKILNSTDNYSIENIVTLYLDVNDATYLNTTYMNQTMDLLDLENENIHYSNIPIVDIQEYDGNIKKRIKMIKETTK